MSVENLVTIDFESDGVHNEHDEDINSKNINCNNRNYPKNDETDVVFNDNNSLMDDRIANESQPLLGGLDHHEAHQIIYNQFPSKLKIPFLDL